MRNCFINIGSGFLKEDEVEIDLIKKNEANEIDIISIDLSLGQTNAFFEHFVEHKENIKQLNVYRLEIDVKNFFEMYTKMNHFFYKLQEKKPDLAYNHITILDSIDFKDKFKYSSFVAEEIIYKIFPMAIIQQIHYISPKCSDPTLNGQPILLQKRLKTLIRKNLSLMTTSQTDKQKAAIASTLEHLLNNKTLADVYIDLRDKINTWNHLGNKNTAFLQSFFQGFRRELISISDHHHRNNLLSHLTDIPSISETNSSPPSP